MKATPSDSAKLIPAATVQANAEVPSSAPATATPPKPGPLDGIASVLNGATVTGLVDGYSSYNFNDPSKGTTALSSAPGDYTALRLFDPRNSQFALNLVELGLVKTPDSDNMLGQKPAPGSATPCSKLT